jgi:hypothetical protein
MFEYEKLAKSYGIDVEIGKGLQILTVPTESKIKIDVGFADSEGNILGNYFQSLRKYKIYRNLSVYGDCAKPLSEILTQDYVFCSNLCVIFDYAYSALWSGKELEIRVNTLARGYPIDDGTGGERLFVSVKNLVDRLNDQANLNDLAKNKTGWGPSRIRKLTLRSAGILTVAFLLSIRYVFPRLISHR